MDNDTGSYITIDDCRDIENTVNEWIEQGNDNPNKHDMMQNKAKGAICILNKIDNIKVSIVRIDGDVIDKVNLQILY